MITRSEFNSIAINGIWKQNSSVVQILGMCPLLAITTSAVNGVMMSLATLIVMALSGFVVSALRHLIPYEIRIPVFILVAAATVTIVDLSMNAYMHSIYLVLGIFIPLIITNCLVLARIEAFAAKNSPLQSLFDGAFMGVGMIWTLGLLGAMREFVGSGTILSGIDALIPGTHAIHVLPESYPGFLAAILPPGAFILLGCMIAGKNWIESRRAARARQQPPAPLSTAGCH